MDGQCVSKHIRAENREIFAIGKKPSKQGICRVFSKEKGDRSATPSPCVLVNRKETKI